MSIRVNWLNPYQDSRGKWLRGNLHTHTSPASDCGRVAASRMVELYQQAGYDFLAISDHMAYTVAAGDGLTFIPAVEWNCQSGKHTGLYAADAGLIRRSLEIADQQELLETLCDTEALTVLNHPNWQLVPHYRREELAEAKSFDAIEIYNGVIERLAGYAIATDKWDYLLDQGKRVLGLAVDDSHVEDDVNKGWICVRAAGRDPDAILSAIRQGNFYCSSGVEITEIARRGRTIEIETADAQEIQMICDGGRQIAKADGPSACFDVPDSVARYVRLEAYGRGSAMAWTQPFFMSDNDADQA